MKVEWVSVTTAAVPLKLVEFSVTSQLDPVTLSVEVKHKRLGIDVRRSCLDFSSAACELLQQ